MPSDGEAQEQSEYRVLLAGGLRALTPRERRIVFLRFHADMTERQIARTVGISQAQVSRLLESALTKLRTELTGTTDRDGNGDSTETAAISPDPSAGVDAAPAPSGDEESGDTAREQAPEAPAPRRPAKARAANGYSGRILVRMPSELHEQLALAAERGEISLNRYVNDALSSSVDGGAAPAAAVEETNGDRPPRQAAHRLRVALATNLLVVVLAATAAIVLLVLALQRGI